MWLRSGCAHGSAVIHQPVTEVIALIWRYKLPQFHLNLLRIFYPVNQSHSVDKAYTVGICYNGRFAVDITHDEVCALAAYAGELKQLIKTVRNLAIIGINKHIHTCTNISGLALPQSARSHNGLDVTDIGSSQFFYSRIFGK